MLYIGDVHGKHSIYYDIIKDHKASVQVGDMGLGFFGHRNADEAFLDNISKIGGDHRFIRGNHDNPSYVRGLDTYISDGTIENGIMYIGGEWSIDWYVRSPELNWWADEELSQNELDRLVKVYKESEPRRMVTHTAPKWVCSALLSHSAEYRPTRTQEAFQKMFTAHSPKEWVFGHWHMSFDKEIEGTRFICLPELGTVELND